MVDLFQTTNKQLLYANVDLAWIGDINLDTSDPGWNPEILIACNIPVPIKGLFQFTKSYFQMERTRYVSTDTYRQRTVDAN